MNPKTLLAITGILSVSLTPNLLAEKPGTNKLGKKQDKTVVVAKSADIHTSFEAAKKAFVGGNMKASAASITKAAALVTSQEAAAEKAHAKSLNTAAADLNTLAKSVGVGEVKDVKVLDQTFANTHQVLAEYYQGKAQRAYDAGDETVAAKAMNAAANHVENAATWAGTKLSDTAKGTVGLLRKVSGGIISGTGTGVEKVGDVLGMGTKTITNIGSKIRGEEVAPEANVAEKAAKGVTGVAGGTVETTGKVTEKATDAVSGTGKGIKKLGEAVSGKKDTETPSPDKTPTTPPKKDQ